MHVRLSLPAVSCTLARAAITPANLVGRVENVAELRETCDSRVRIGHWNRYRTQRAAPSRCLSRLRCTVAWALMMTCTAVSAATGRRRDTR